MNNIEDTITSLRASFLGCSPMAIDYLANTFNKGSFSASGTNLNPSIDNLLAYSHILHSYDWKGISVYNTYNMDALFRQSDDLILDGYKSSVPDRIMTPQISAKISGLYHMNYVVDYDYRVQSIFSNLAKSVLNSINNNHTIYQLHLSHLGRHEDNRLLRSHSTSSYHAIEHELRSYILIDSKNLDHATYVAIHQELQVDPDYRNAICSPKTTIYAWTVPHYATLQTRDDKIQYNGIKFTAFVLYDVLISNAAYHSVGYDQGLYAPNDVLHDWLSKRNNTKKCNDIESLSDIHDPINELRDILELKCAYFGDKGDHLALICHDIPVMNSDDILRLNQNRIDHNRNRVDSFIGDFKFKSW